MESEAIANLKVSPLLLLGGLGGCYFYHSAKVPPLLLLGVLVGATFPSPLGCLRLLMAPLACLHFSQSSRLPATIDGTSCMPLLFPVLRWLPRLVKP